MEQQPLSYEELCLHLAADGAASYRILARCENEQESGAFAPPTEYLRPSATDGAPRRDIHSAASQDAFGEPADSLPFTASTAAETGDRLFRALLPDRVRDLFQRAIGRTEKRSRIGLRLRIELDYHDARVAWLARLPWELLFWAEDHRFLALSRTSPVVRGGMVSHPARALALSGPLDILAVAASPSGLPELDLARERRGLEAALAAGPSARATFVEPAGAEELRGIWSRQAFQVLHFMGHGGFDAASGHGRLMLARADRSPEPLVDEQLVELLDRDSPPALVVLNACHGAVGHVIPQGYPAGLAPSLILAGLPAVVAMRQAIPDSAAIAWSGAFYGALASGQPLEAAVAEGRKSIHCLDPSAADWAIPALFLGSVQPHVADAEAHPGAPARHTLVTVKDVEGVHNLEIVGRSVTGSGRPGDAERVEVRTGTVRNVGKARIVGSEET